MPKFGNYECPNCHGILREVPVDFGRRFTQVVVGCPFCATSDTIYHMDWLPEIGRISAGNGPTFTSFETVGPDGVLTRVNSITELRAMERRSEQMERNGEGQRMVWRDFTNDQSNRDAHAYSKSGWEAEDYPGAPSKADFAKLKMLTEQQALDRQSGASAPLALAESPISVALPPE